MERRQKRNLENGKDNSYITWITWLLIIIGAITFMISYTLYGKRIEGKTKTEKNETSMEGTMGKLLNKVSLNEITEASASIGKSIDDSKNAINNNEIETDKDKGSSLENKMENEKIAVNTSAVERKALDERENKEKENNNEQTNKKSTEENNKTEREVEAEIQEPLKFVKPVDGEVIKEYSKDNLIYSNTLEEWTTHLGIDYAAERTSIVKAAADGTIKSIKNDPRYGLTIIIEHKNGFTSMYSNLLSTEFVIVGEEVLQGQTIGTVGNTATFEIADETHLHFEIMKDGKSVDPNMYIE